MSRHTVVLFALLTACVSAPLGMAQEFRATVTGRVTDSLRGRYSKRHRGDRECRNQRGHEVRHHCPRSLHAAFYRAVVAASSARYRSRSPSRSAWDFTSMHIR
jgi:hypothetical protein